MRISCDVHLWSDFEHPFQSAIMAKIAEDDDTRLYVATQQ